MAESERISRAESNRRKENSRQVIGVLSDADIQKAEKRKRPRIFMSPHVEGAVYTALMIEHDDPDNDPRAWDWSLVDFTGVTDRRVIVKCVGFWDNDSERNEQGPWSEQPDLYTVRPTFAARRETRGRLDR